MVESLLHIITFNLFFTEQTGSTQPNSKVKNILQIMLFKILLAAKTMAVISDRKLMIKD